MITITKERLQWLANISGRDDIDDIDGGEIRELPLAFASKEKMTLVLRINRKCLASTLHPAGCCNKHFCTG